MAESFYTILTNIGLAAIANAQVTQSKVDFATFVVGDGNGAYYNPTSTQANLVKEVWRGPISGITIDENNANWVIVEAVIPSIAGGFNVREIGVLDSAGQLLAVGKVPETYKPVTAEGSLKDLYLRMILEVSNASVITLKVDPAVIFASKKYVDDKDDTHANIKATTTQYGHTKLLNSVTSTSNELAATPNAVKTAYDKVVSVETNANTHAKDTVLHTYYGTAAGTDAKTITLSPAPTGYVDGMAVVFKNAAANTGAVTLNVNNLGVKALVKANGKALSAGNLAVNGIYTARYNSTTGNFILQGEGGGLDEEVLLIRPVLSTQTQYTTFDADCAGSWFVGAKSFSSLEETLVIININTLSVKSKLSGRSNRNARIATNGVSVYFDYISSGNGYGLEAISVDTAIKTHELPTTSQPRLITYDKIKDNLFVFNLDAAPNKLCLLDKNLGLVGTASHGVSSGVSAQDGVYLYIVVANGNNSTIYKINKTTLVITTSIYFNQLARSIAVDDEYVYTVDKTKTSHTDYGDTLRKRDKNTLQIVDERSFTVDLGSVFADERSLFIEERELIRAINKVDLTNKGLPLSWASHNQLNHLKTSTDGKPICFGPSSGILYDLT